MSGSETKNRWVCPNDRELMLRARLDTGWSVKSNVTQNASNVSNNTKSEQINESEQETILKVLRKAQQSEQIEKERINRMLDRLNNMKRNAKGDGRSKCVLCSEEFGFFGAQCHICKDCNKSVCSKCGIDSFTPENEPFWLCKICSETRELWKKSGAWFLNSLPTFSSSSSAIPSIRSPSSDNTNGSQVSSVRSPSPVIRRRMRSPSPRSHRFRSPEIADYGMIFDVNRPEDSYSLSAVEKDEYYNAIKQRDRNISRSTNHLTFGDGL